MKKKVLYVFSLVLYLLVTCTFLSQKIETEMYIQAEVSERKPIGHIGGSFNASPDALFEDEDGQHLYEVVESDGWKSGVCIKEIPDSVWGTSAYGKVTFPNDRSYYLVESASRMPKEGEMVMIVKSPARTTKYVPFTDQYLVYYPEGVPEDFVLPENSQIISQSENAVLLDMGDIVFPFFEQKAKQMSTSLENEECRVFSMTEVEEFLEQLPRVAVLITFLLFPVLIWICSGVMVKNASANRDLLLVNVGITVIFFVMMLSMLGQIDFPASLLPADNIFDMTYYIQEFSTIIEAQEALGVAAQGVKLLLPEVRKIVACIWGVGIIASMAVSAVELFIIKKKKYN